MSFKVSYYSTPDESRVFVVTVLKKEDGSFEGVINEQGLGYYKTYSSSSEKELFGFLKEDLVEKANSSHLSSFESIDRLSSLAAKKVDFVEEKYQEMLSQKDGTREVETITYQP